jgi:hypothetical protein
MYSILLEINYEKYRLETERKNAASSQGVYASERASEGVERARRKKAAMSWLQRTSVPAMFIKRLAVR